MNLRLVATALLLGLLCVTFTAVLIALIKSAVVAVVPAGALLFAQYWFRPDRPVRDEGTSGHRP